MINLKILGAVVVVASALSSSAVQAQWYNSIRTHAKLNSPAARVLERGPPPTIGFGHQLGERHIASRQRRTRLSATGAIPTPCRPACRTARWAGRAAGVRMLPVTASSAGPAPISRVATASSISASRSSALTLNSSGGPKGAACFVPELWLSPRISIQIARWVHDWVYERPRSPDRGRVPSPVLRAGGGPSW